MSDDRLFVYLDHMRKAAMDARSFVDGLCRVDFLADRRTQQAVIMSLVILGEASTRIMDRYAEFALRNILKFRGEICAECAIASPTGISTSTWK